MLGETSLLTDACPHNPPCTQPLLTGTPILSTPLSSYPSHPNFRIYQAGEMLGETSLLKEGRATASVAADTDTTLVAIDGRSLEQVPLLTP